MYIYMMYVYIYTYIYSIYILIHVSICFEPLYLENNCAKFCNFEI